MSLPNQLTLLRILMFPGIVASLIYYSPERDWLRFLALGLFVAAVATDALDGFIARTRHQQTHLGALLDPLADKLLIVGTLISCAVIRGLPEWMHVPAWFNILVISRDALLVSGAAFLMIVKGTRNMRPNFLGKCTAASQMLVIPAVLLGLPIKGALLAAASVLTFASMLVYLRRGVAIAE